MTTPLDAIAEAIEQTAAKVGSLPYMRPWQAVRLGNLFAAHDIRHVLELGTYHGIGAAYMASIVQARGGGSVSTIDRPVVLELSPTPAQLLADFPNVTLHIEERSLTMRLLKMLEEPAPPLFDFCYFDGGHNWDVTGFAFFLVDRLLKPGGWVLFDDLDWVYTSMIKDGVVPEWMKPIPPDEREMRQVRKVWDLLVTQHPGYTDFSEEGAWGFARKKP